MGVAGLLPPVAQKRRLTIHVTIPCGRFRLVLSGRPLLMGVLNVTPDSFSDGGRSLSSSAAIRHGERLVAEGADLLDIGGESTRPGSLPVPLEEELRRVLPVIQALAKRLSVPISVDTSKAEVARQAVDAGASMVNDVTALRGDRRMAEVVARARVPIILMHMRGSPQTMQRHPRYREVVSDVRTFLARAASSALEQGIARTQILLDPGLGFGKTVTHNLLLLRHLDSLVGLGYPVVIGASRKSFIGRVLNIEVEERLAGGLACIAQAMHQGAHIVRVHDVAPTRHFIQMWHAIAQGHASREISSI